jgi:hypothetical protein
MPLLIGVKNWLPLACNGQPVLQHVLRIAQDFSKHPSHPKMGMGIDDGRGRFEDACAEPASTNFSDFGGEIQVPSCKFPVKFSVGW